MSVSARNMKNFRINRQPIHQILVNPLTESKGDGRFTFGAGWQAEINSDLLPCKGVDKIQGYETLVIA